MDTFDTTTEEIGRQAFEHGDIKEYDGYDPITGTLRVRYATDDEESILLSIVGIVAAVSGQEPYSITPLYDVIDAESLLSVLTTARGNDIKVSFTYEGYPITVSSSGEIIVRLTT
ncbi:hypothetical protein A4G99_12685 [Haladaptatus sp. R4]|uniref:HalOD1 output domain-containing protein n=1 Tax=Haladaptatus sp. R4 TaxID=1679489 RepID=UPI0007B46900|nr:HalOD1 output domain-containing protein [Haladaptatus sp. R4]KZN23720.1 hypothetical protein A4G99_12685 [Haladaptatus sp. R4]